MLSIDLLSYQPQLKLRKGAAKTEVFDAVRRKWLVLTPEESVRQLTLLYLLDNTSVPLAHIRTEMSLLVNGLPKRCDILLFDIAAQPLLLVECKAPRVAITPEVMYQALRYNLTLQVPYFLLTNGIATHFFELDYKAGTWRERNELAIAY